jgi:hypothetical protein
MEGLMFDSPFVVPIVLFITLGTTAILFPIARAFARRMERGTSPTASPEITARLERMEQAIDSIAVEVERISEGQRFTTRLLSDRARSEAPVRETT